MSKIAPTPRLNSSTLQELVDTCQLLITEGISWEPSSLGVEYPAIHVYDQDEKGPFIALLSVADDVGYLFEKIRMLLSGEPVNEQLN